MNSVKYKGKLLSYNSDKNEVTIDGKLDLKKEFSPSFVNNGEKDATFIGFIDNKLNKFISLTGKEFNTIQPEEITL